ncbi:hypothetical protein A2U01_0041731, partial [Trifolium medium]|nr:hypothetical protein [Trifolium medium]
RGRVYPVPDSTIDPTGSQRFSTVLKQNWFCMLTKLVTPPVPGPTSLTGRSGPVFM